VYLDKYKEYMMEKSTLNQFTQEVIQCDPQSPWTPSLRMHLDEKISVYYAPFEYINLNAKLVICGITPGATQAAEALSIAKTGLLLGSSLAEIQNNAKQAASFKGFRKPLSEMLDLVGLNVKLGINSCEELFSSRTDLVHYTSALRYPVTMLNGDNYSGSSPKITSHPFFRKMMDNYLSEEIRCLGQDCLWLPLGTAAQQALSYMIDSDVLKPHQLLDGLPHPSGANAERIAYFLGNKPKNNLSIKTNAEKIDAAKLKLITKIKAA
jgi:hypothetical protein